MQEEPGDPTPARDAGHLRRAGSRAGNAVLLVSAEPFVRELLATQLRAAGCFPMAVASAEDGRRLAAQVLPDLVVVDLDDRADQDVAWVVELQRVSTSKAVRTVLLSADLARDGGADHLRCGIDLCVAKPFEPHALMQQLLRLMRATRIGAPRLRAHAGQAKSVIELDSDQLSLRLLLPGGWQTLHLPWTEHKLMACLLAAAPRALGREAIRDHVWGSAQVDVRTVDQNVRRLRTLLHSVGARGLVKTVQGVGYALDVDGLPPSLA